MEIISLRIIKLKQNAFLISIISEFEKLTSGVTFCQTDLFYALFNSAFVKLGVFNNRKKRKHHEFSCANSPQECCAVDLKSKTGPFTQICFLDKCILDFRSTSLTRVWGRKLYFCLPVNCTQLRRDYNHSLIKRKINLIEVMVHVLNVLTVSLVTLIIIKKRLVCLLIAKKSVVQTAANGLLRKSLSWTFRRSCAQKKYGALLFVFFRRCWRREGQGGGGVGWGRGVRHPGAA